MMLKSLTSIEVRDQHPLKQGLRLFLLLDLLGVESESETNIH